MIRDPPSNSIHNPIWGLLSVLKICLSLSNQNDQWYWLDVAKFIVCPKLCYNFRERESDIDGPLSRSSDQFLCEQIIFKIHRFGRRWVWVKYLCDTTHARNLLKPITVKRLESFWALALQIVLNEGETVWGWWIHQKDWFVKDMQGKFSK